MFLYCWVLKLKYFFLVNFKFFIVFNVLVLNDLKDGSIVNLDFLVKDGIVISFKYFLKMFGNGELKVKKLIV